MTCLSAAPQQNKLITQERGALDNYLITFATLRSLGHVAH